MRRVLMVITIVAAVCGLGAGAWAARPSRSSVQPATPAPFVAVPAAAAPAVAVRPLVADRLARDVVALAPVVEGEVALVTSAPSAEPAPSPADEVSAGVEVDVVIVRCGGVDGAFRVVASASACPGAAALRIERP